MMTEFEHVNPEFREEARQPAEERIQRVRVERWITYPRAEFVLSRLSELLTYPPRDRMPCLLLFGATGIGKTKIIRKFIRDHPFRFEVRTGITTAPVITMQMPPEPDENERIDHIVGCRHRRGVTRRCGAAFQRMAVTRSGSLSVPQSHDE